MLILVTKITPRVQYTVDLIFKDIFGLEVTLTENVAIFQEHQAEKWEYATEIRSTAPFIRSSGLLFSAGYEKISPPTMFEKKEILLFPEPCELGFDIFSAVFFMVSRYEEYFPSQKDVHGRFQAVNSFAYKNGFLEFPVVNIWINKLREWLCGKFKDIKFKIQHFSARITYDIDVAYAFKGRSITRNIAASIKDVLLFRLSNLRNRIQVLSGTAHDPWDVYKSLTGQLAAYKLRSVFFFLLGDYSRYNKNLKPGSAILNDLIADIDCKAEIGIHPSYDSYLNISKLTKEKEKLEDITGDLIFKSRQHYLRINIPKTYQILIKAGIREDYSMGYAEFPGFRAGMCIPFYFYDLNSESTTCLKIYPVTIMEGTLFEYLKLPVVEAEKYIDKLINRVNGVNGMFISLWHNHTVSDSGKYKGWKIVHDNMLGKVSKLIQDK